MAGFQRHVQRHQRTYLIIGLGAMIFSLFTFSVSQALYSLAREGGGETTVGTFTRSDGRVIEFPVTEYNHYRMLTNSGLLDRFYQTDKDQRAWEHKIWLEECNLAGIQVPDEQVKQYVNADFKGLTRNQYISVLLRYGFNSPGQYEEALRDVLRIQQLRALMSLADPVTSKDIYERFKTDNTLIKLAYVAFPFEKYRAQQGAEPSEDDLKNYYSTMNFTEKQRDFFTEEKVGVEAIYVDFGAADVAQFTDVLTGMAEPTEEEIKRQYDASKKRYQVPEQAAPAPGETKPPEGEAKPPEGETKPPEGETKPPEGETKPPEGEAKPPEGQTPKMRPATLDEAREQVKKDLRLKQVLEKAATDYRAARAELEAKLAPPAPPSPPGEGEGKPAGETGEKKGGPRQDAVPPQEPPKTDAPEPEQPKITPEQMAEELGRKLQEIAAKYHLLYKNFEGLHTHDELKKLEIIGDENFPFFVRSLEVNDISPSRIPIEKQQHGYLLRMREKDKAHEKPFAEVRDKLLESYLRSKRREAAEKEAKEFREALVAKARADAAAEIAPIESEATKQAEKRITDENIQDEDKKKEVREEEQKKAEVLIRPLIDKHLHKHFDEVAKERGLTVDTIDYFRKSFYSTRQGQKLEEGAKKFLISPSSRLQNAAIDTVSEVLTQTPFKAEDQDKGSCYVAMVMDRKDPEPSDMTPADRDRAENEVERTRQMNDPPAYFGRKDPRAWFKLQQQFSIQETAKQAKPTS